MRTGMLVSLFVLWLSALALAAAAPRRVDPRDESASAALGWRLGIQTWTFRDRTVFEAIDAAARLGISMVELYPGQRLGTAYGDAKLDTDLSAQLRTDLLAHLEKSHVTANSFGVVNAGTDEAAWRRTFEFARSLKMQTISCEPPADALALVERLATEYSIKAAIHNHPKPSTYWNPDTVLQAVKDRSPLIGACADTGHWPRSGLSALESLKKLDGRIIELHFKDITDGQDRPWGTGSCDARGMLDELRRQKFRGVILIEYETGSGPELEATVAKCIEFFDKACRDMPSQAPAAP